MNYFNLNLALRKNKLYLFALNDIKNLFPEAKEKTIKNNLNRWLVKGYFNRLKKNLYEIGQNSELKIPDLYIANRLYEPSYVSLETALSFYSIIPDIAATVTSITTRATRRFKNRYGLFSYKTCKKEAFKGYKIMAYAGFKLCIADKEKALVDFLYFRLRSGFPIELNEERFNKKILNTLNWKRAFYYAGFFNKKIVKLLKKCEEYSKC